VPRMTIYNSDGSVPEMCGNGVRCFVMALVGHCGYAGNPLVVQTGAGVKTCRWTREAAGGMRVSVEMGPVRAFDGIAPLKAGLSPDLVEVASLLSSEGRSVLGAGTGFDGRHVAAHLVSTGNPHAVLIGEFSPEEMQVLGPVLCAHPRFPAGANIGFLTVESRTALRLTVHERGCGFTLACGTGAVAATSACVATGRCPAGERIELQLPGGKLAVTVAPDFSQSVLEGPAAEVFRGYLKI